MRKMERNRHTLYQELVRMPDRVIAVQAAQRNLRYDEWKWFIDRQKRAYSEGVDIWTLSPQLYTNYPLALRSGKTKEEAWQEAVAGKKYIHPDRTIEEHLPDLRGKTAVGGGWEVKQGHVIKTRDVEKKVIPGLKGAYAGLAMFMLVVLALWYFLFGRMRRE